MNSADFSDGELQNLYQDVIVDHGRRPRNFGELEDANRRAAGINPLCGDQLTVSLHLVDGMIEEIAFTGSGCAISQASASLMTVALKGKPVAEAQQLFDHVHDLLTVAPDGSPPPDDLGKLAVLSGVWEFPTRVKCASLAWQALRAALDDDDESVVVDHEPHVSTE